MFWRFYDQGAECMEFSGGVLRNRVTWALNRHNSSSGQSDRQPLTGVARFSGQVAARLSVVAADPSP